jgi:hypothetical protein
MRRRRRFGGRSKLRNRHRRARSRHLIGSINNRQVDNYTSILSQFGGKS